MSTLLDLYMERQKDITTYFEFLRFYDSIHLRSKSELEAQDAMGHSLTHLPCRELQKILRANAYVLLYGLVESTMTGVVVAIQDAILDKRIPLTSLNADYRRLYYKYKIGNIGNCKKKVETLEEVVGNVERQSLLDTIEIDLSLSGNVDFTQINKIITALMPGTKLPSIDPRDYRKIEAAFAKTKQTRNHLAHGNVTFSDKGANFTLQDIEEHFKHIDNVLRDVCTVTDLFIVNDGFLNHSDK